MYLLGFNYVDYREGDENIPLSHDDPKASEPLSPLQVRQNTDLTYSLLYRPIPDSWTIERSDDGLSWTPYSPPAPFSSVSYGTAVIPVVPNGKQVNFFRATTNP